MLDLQAQMDLSHVFISRDIAVLQCVSRQVGFSYLGVIMKVGPRRGLRQSAASLYKTAVRCVTDRGPGPWPSAAARLECRDQKPDQADRAIGPGIRAAGLPHSWPWVMFGRHVRALRGEPSTSIKSSSGSRVDKTSRPRIMSWSIVDNRP